MKVIDNSFAGLADSIADWDPDGIVDWDPDSIAVAADTGRCCRSTASPATGTDIEDPDTVVVDTDRTSFVDKQVARQLAACRPVDSFACRNLRQVVDRLADMQLFCYCRHEGSPGS